MPTIETQREICRRNMIKINKLRKGIPRTQKQREADRKNLEKAIAVPRTEKQRKASRINGCKATLIIKGRPHPHKGNVFGKDIIKHHNDLCHGAQRPYDITLMTHGEHTSLHNRLRSR